MILKYGWIPFSMCMCVMNSMDGRILEPQNNVFISIFFFLFFFFFFHKWISRRVTIGQNSWSHQSWLGLISLSQIWTSKTHHRLILKKKKKKRIQQNPPCLMVFWGTQNIATSARNSEKLNQRPWNKIYKWIIQGVLCICPSGLKGLSENHTHTHKRKKTVEGQFTP